MKVQLEINYNNYTIVILFYKIKVFYSYLIQII